VKISLSREISSLCKKNIIIYLIRDDFVQLALMLPFLHELVGREEATVKYLNFV